MRPQPFPSPPLAEGLPFTPRQMRVAVLLLVPIACLLGGLAVVSQGPVVLVGLIALPTAAVLGVQVLNKPFVGLAVLTLILTFFPVARLGLGPMPLYLSDVLVAGTLIGLYRRGLLKIDGYGRWILIYLIFWLPAWFFQVGRIGVAIEPAYGFIRHVLAVGAFFIGWAMARELRSRRFWNLFCIGVISTSLIALLQAMPPTREAGKTITTALIGDTAKSAYAAYPERAFGLFLAPTALSGFLALLLPLFVVELMRDRSQRRRLTGITIAFALMALIATVSRQWVVGAIFGFLLLAFLQPRSLGRVSGGLLGAGAILTLVFGLGLLNSSYVGERFSRLSDPTKDQNVNTRLQRQTDFFHYALENPEIVGIGNGFATQDLVQRGVISGEQAEALRAGYSDNSFLLEMWNHGLIAAVLYIGLVFTALRRGVKAARKAGRDGLLIAGLTASLMTGIALHFTDNFFSESVFLKTWLWLTIGWLMKETSTLDATTNSGGSAEGTGSPYVRRSSP